MKDKTLDQGEGKKSKYSKKRGREVNDRCKTCGKNWVTDKLKNPASLGYRSPLESGQSERWYFHLSAN